MGKLTLLIGGARSGKSTYAVKLGMAHERVAYIATLQPGNDEEMLARIESHRRSRPGNWLIFEEPFMPEQAIRRASTETDFIILDCATLWLTNLILNQDRWKISGPSQNNCEDKILERVAQLLKEVKSCAADVCIVTNEVGMGIVPDNKLARLFRDVAGRANQMLADAADEVLFMIAGIPLRVKPHRSEKNSAFRTLDDSAETVTRYAPEFHSRNADQKQCRRKW